MGDFSEILLTTETILKKCVVFVRSRVVFLRLPRPDPLPTCPIELFYSINLNMVLKGIQNAQTSEFLPQNFSPISPRPPRYAHYEEEVERKQSKRKKSGDVFTDKYFEIHDRCQSVQLRGAANNEEKNRALRAALNAELYVLIDARKSPQPYLVPTCLESCTHALCVAIHPTLQPQRKGPPPRRG